MTTCPLCCQPMTLTRPNGVRRVYCSRPCRDTACHDQVRADQARVDEMAVVRLLEGWPVASTRGERIEAVAVLTAAGRSSSWIAGLLHVTERSVERYRAEFHQREAAA